MISKIFHRPGAEKAAPPYASRLGYLPGLDGLRALAVLAVLFYHADLLWLPGGFLGVEVFFVVSGYLITSLLLSEYRSHNQIDLKQFWMRRARRLLPAVYILIFSVLVYSVIFLPDEVASLRADALSAFTYVTNWYLIFAQKSYFESMGRPSLLQHLWSLAVEEQFYLLWPLLFALVLTRVNARVALLLLMIGATVSALWMGFQYVPDADPSRIYYGTDTRAAGLLIGAALAFVWMPRSEGNDSRIRRWSLEVVGIFAFVGLIAANLWLDEYNPFLYQGGMLLVGGATALVIAAVVNPLSPLLGPILSVGVLRWIGQRSYSLYLWHWPVFMLTRPQLDVTIDGWQLLAVRLAATFVLAEVSFRFIETPFRQDLLGKIWNAWKQSGGARRWTYSFAGACVLAALLVGGSVLGNAVINAQPPQDQQLVLVPPEDDSPIIDTRVSSVEPVDPTETTASEIPTSSDLSSVSFVIPDPLTDIEFAPAVPSSPDPSMVARIESLHPPRYNLGEEHERAIKAYAASYSNLSLDTRQTIEGMTQPHVAVAKPPTVNLPAPAAIVSPPHTGPVAVFAIGDSVMLGASLYLEKTVPDMDVDAKLGRQVSAALQILQQHKDAHDLPSTVIVHLGNNGTFSQKQFDQMMAVLSDVPHVIFLTTRVPRTWETPNNNALEEGVKRYPNATLIDWYTFSQDHPEWFWKDGIHLRPEGAKVYANLIATTIAQP
jgi:peptidoglycan/LPS O-acetylase OafA/YrhL